MEKNKKEWNLFDFVVLKCCVNICYDLKTKLN